MSSADARHACVFGLAWGDEGKGKVVDRLSSAFDVVVRFNGGANAGHTVCIGSEKFALHLIPTGLLREHATGVVGPGVALDPIAMLSEIDGLRERGVAVGANLKISDRAHLVLAYHKVEDDLSERAAGKDKRIGTTARGIGPCYADKMRRSTAVRAGDLLHDPDVLDRVRHLAQERVRVLVATYGDAGGLDVDGVVADVNTARERLAVHVCDTTEYLHSAMRDGKRVLFEGANGLLLDVDHGTYPFVTSSNTGPHGVFAGAGVTPDCVPTCIGVTKAYWTRVGSGPFVSELDDATGDRIRTQGHEFGTTTGRPRRCGWFDAVACRYTADLSGLSEMAMMHLDTLTGLDPVGICIAYELDGQTSTSFPADPRRLERAKPVIDFLPGWSQELRDTRHFEDLPDGAQRYVERIESLIGRPVSMIGVGPEREQTLLRGSMRSLAEVIQPSIVP